MVACTPALPLPAPPRSEAELLGAVLAGPEPAAAFLRSGERLARMPFGQRRSLGVARMVTEHGIPPGHAIRLAALWELAERWFLGDRPRITNAADALPVLQPLLADTVPRLVVLSLAGDGRLLDTASVAAGATDVVQARPRDVLVAALRTGADAVLVARIVPDPGRAEPTAHDRSLHDQLRRACALVGLRLLDHLVVTAHTHRRVADESGAQAKASSPVSALPRMRVCTSSVPS